LIDFRSPEEYNGDMVTYEGQRPGHIPTAMNLPWLELLGEKNGKFFGEKSEISRLLSERIAADPYKDKIVCYCGMGPRAALGYVAFHMLGYRNMSLYDRSYNEWSAKSELPVES
jgi:thiosulfate/3-mercaptopyruvate sulfurtransferase